MLREYYAEARAAIAGIQAVVAENARRYMATFLGEVRGSVGPKLGLRRRIQEGSVQHQGSPVACPESIHGRAVPGRPWLRRSQNDPQNSRHCSRGRSGIHF